MDYAILGQRIRYYRQQRLLTQEQLAERTGVSASFMGHIERGSRIASLETLMRLCDALQVTPNDLLADDAFFEKLAVPEQISVSPRKLLNGIALLLRQQENP